MSETPDRENHSQHLPLEKSLQAINVLIIGEFQQGKSTLIKQLNRYAKQPPLSISIGSGNLSCTKVVGQYNITAKLEQYCLLNPDSTPIGRLSHEELCDLDRDEVLIRPISQDFPEPIISFSFIDTPGLDDSDGDDFEIMSAILGRLGELSHINAIVYVRNISKPFSHSFRVFFTYIQRSLPSLSAGLIIVHTSFTLEKISEFLTNSRNLVTIRQDAFKSATNLELIHFFMDNEPSKYSPYAIISSLNSCYKPLNHLSSQKPIPVTNLQLLKTSKMKIFDNHIITELLAIRENLRQKFQSENSLKTISDQKLYTTNLEITKSKKKLERVQEQLSELENGPDIILGTRSVSDSYSFIFNLLLQQKFNIGSRRIETIADYPIAYVSKTANGGSQWTEENHSGCHWSAVLTSGLFCDLGGTVTFYTTSNIRHS